MHTSDFDLIRVDLVKEQFKLVTIITHSLQMIRFSRHIYRLVVAQVIMLPLINHWDIFELIFLNDLSVLNVIEIHSPILHLSHKYQRQIIDLSIVNLTGLIYTDVIAFVFLQNYSY